MKDIFLLYIIPAICWLLVTGIPSIITIVRNAKTIKAEREAAKVAKTEQEKAEAEARAEAAKNEIYLEIKRLVADAEAKYEDVNTFLKQNEKSAGTLKKAYVETAIKAFCLENGFAFNMTDLDKIIEDEVAYTKTVNAKK